MVPATPMDDITSMLANVVRTVALLFLHSTPVRDLRQQQGALCSASVLCCAGVTETSSPLMQRAAWCSTL